MLILGIECASTACSAAVLKTGKKDEILAFIHTNDNKVHSETLLCHIDKALKVANKTIKDIDLIAIATGPGSFTGLRIGIALVKGISDIAQVDVVPVSTLEALCYNIQNKGIIAACMDARRNQIYNAVFKHEDGYERLCDDRAISVEDFYEEIKKYNEPVYLVGDGAKLVYEKLNDKRFILPDEKYLYGMAQSVAMLGKKYYNKKIKSVDLMPNYLRAGQAGGEK